MVVASGRGLRNPLFDKKVQKIRILGFFNNSARIIIGHERLSSDGAQPVFRLDLLHVLTI